jgi:hypothetical protein
MQDLDPEMSFASDAGAVPSSLGEALACLIDAIVRQVVLALTFQSDGQGLPRNVTRSFWVLLGMAGLMSLGRYPTDLGTAIWLVAPVIVIATLAMLHALRGRQLVCLSLFLCCAIGTNALATFQVFVGLQPSGLIDLWGLAAFVECAQKVLKPKGRLG